MKVRLVQNIPVAKKHGMTVGRILEVVHEVPRRRWVRGAPKVFVMGGAGERVGLHRHEYTEVLETQDDLREYGERMERLFTEAYWGRDSDE